MFPGGILNTSIADWNNWSLKWKSGFFLLENIKRAGADFIFYYCKNQTSAQNAKILQIRQQWVLFNPKCWKWLFNEIVFP